MIVSLRAATASAPEESGPTTGESLEAPQSTTQDVAPEDPKDEDKSKKDKTTKDSSKGKGPFKGIIAFIKRFDFYFLIFINLFLLFCLLFIVLL